MIRQLVIYSRKQNLLRLRYASMSTEKNQTEKVSKEDGKESSFNEENENVDQLKIKKEGRSMKVTPVEVNEGF